MIEYQSSYGCAEQPNKNENRNSLAREMVNRKNGDVGKKNARSLIYVR